MKVDVLFQGFPGKSSRGFLGWSSCCLIRQPGEAPILYDTAGFNERYKLVEKLSRLGVQPEEIGIIFLSHFHFDHAVNFALFPKAICYLHEEEVSHIRENGHRDWCIPLEMFPALERSGRLEILTGSQGQVGGITWLHTPGHTPGLYSLLLECHGEKWALVSDTIKNEQELLTGQVAMSWDEQLSRKSIHQIKEWADIIVPGHDRLLRLVRNQGETKVVPLEPTRVEITLPEKRGEENKFVLER